MARGRCPSGPELAERLDGSSAAKLRLKVILQTIAGRRRVSDACGELGIKRSAFHELRSRAMEWALEGLEPRPVGRPPRRESEEDSRVAELETEVRDLRIRLRAAQIREEIAIAMPHLLKSEKAESQKNLKRREKRNRKARA